MENALQASSGGNSQKTQMARKFGPQNPGISGVCIEFNYFAGK